MNISDEELQSRVIYALLMPAARLARVFGVSVADFKELLDMAYYHEVKRANLKTHEAAALMGVSTSKVALMARRLKENFAKPEHELERRIEFMLWAEPLSLVKVQQVMTDVDADEVARAIETLLAEGRIAEDQSGRTPVFTLAITESRRAWNTWLARIDGLNNGLSTVCNAVLGRFFNQDERAFARNLTFRIRRQDHDRLRKFYEEELFKLIVALDAACEGEEDVEAMDLSIFWTPGQPMQDMEKGKK